VRVCPGTSTSEITAELREAAHRNGAVVEVLEAIEAFETPQDSILVRAWGRPRKRRLVDPLD